MIVDPASHLVHPCVAWHIRTVCGGGVQSSSATFAIEHRLRHCAIADEMDLDTGFRVSFTLSAERPRP
jgi:hypothetical protein